MKLRPHKGGTQKHKKLCYRGTGKKALAEDRSKLGEKETTTVSFLQLNFSISGYLTQRSFVEAK